ncbi:DsrE/DsrF/DrsH-like family protein [Neomoorella thermoacetica]|uniref:Sulfur carrier protein DsrE2 n=2 Tax=Neomoorella thermoacetica TaxID=1525 RepID=A0A1D7X7I0_NEOTH|nr:DsrE/DsrF/DrsH-like family protein [Moorella thermoacetica]AKX93186.1 hypothetical protein MOTHE_c03730 [Moorella thermoacetica]AKX95828.1 hypothetical protein MOTHA_c04620 [Moorella thermoacetica]AOQ22850.1 hypothetical protein Maut_00375 [Moorella thermoacetica]APC07517.1 hypothetical protein MTJW_03370 [Moorella thermoacetica]OIQ08244.1 hypothetical protein MOOR_20980 [Moorella thermoacetica]
MAEDKMAIICFSGDLDKALATFNLATGAAASGMEVTIFFTFWGINLLKKPRGRRGASSLLGRMFDWMMPSGPDRLPLSKFNMAGLGPFFMKKQMRSKKVQAVSEFLALAREMGVKFVACIMSMQVMEIPEEDLIDGVEFGGVAAFLQEAANAKISLFI